VSLTGGKSSDGIKTLLIDRSSKEPCSRRADVKKQEGTGRTRGQRQKTEVISRAETKQAGRGQEISPEMTAGKSGMILQQSGTEEMTGAGLNAASVDERQVLP